jgi:hypothetical protein
VVPKRPAEFPHFPGGIGTIAVRCETNEFTMPIRLHEEDGEEFPFAQAGGKLVKENHAGFGPSSMRLADLALQTARASRRLARLGGRRGPDGC